MRIAFVPTAAAHSRSGCTDFGTREVTALTEFHDAR
jgi:hypothetical protein